MKRKEIRNAVNQAIDNIIYEGCTDVAIFGNPFEIKLLNNKETRKKITDDLVLNLDNILNSNGKFDILKFNKI